MTSKTIEIRFVLLLLLLCDKFAKSGQDQTRSGFPKFVTENGLLRVDFPSQICEDFPSRIWEDSWGSISVAEGPPAREASVPPAGPRRGAAKGLELLVYIYLNDPLPVLPSGDISDIVV